MTFWHTWNSACIALNLFTCTLCVWIYWSSSSSCAKVAVPIEIHRIVDLHRSALSCCNEDRRDSAQARSLSYIEAIKYSLNCNKCKQKSSVCVCFLCGSLNDYDFRDTGFTCNLLPAILNERIYDYPRVQTGDCGKRRHEHKAMGRSRGEVGLGILAYIENSHTTIHGGVEGIMKPGERGAHKEYELYNVRYEIWHH